MNMRNLLTKIVVGLCVALASAGLWASAVMAADEFPTKPVTLIIPVGAGGSHDLTARAVTSVAQQLPGPADHRSAQTGRRRRDRFRNGG